MKKLSGSRYFEKSAFCGPLIAENPAADLAMIVTIPCSNEPDLLRTLASLNACERLAGKTVEVIVVVNASEMAAESIKTHNLETFSEGLEWAKNGDGNTGLRFHFLHFSDLPARSAGVGLARKIGMDEAARRLEKAQNPRGPIVCLDADSLVQSNYLIEIDRFFAKNGHFQTASIHFEHPLEGDEFPDSIYEAILFYELHLRFYIHSLRRAGIPTAFQTIGSSMAARADAYVLEGGMNRRQAGEDFYFLHKFTQNGRLGNLTSTTVRPSPRVSDRVPFGTGRAVGEMLEGKPFSTYSPQIFDDLGLFFSKMKSEKANILSHDEILNGLPKSVSSFLEEENFEKKLTEIRANTSNSAAFEKRFFRWMDAFRAMKMVHWMRDRFYPNVEVEAAASIFLGKKIGTASAREMLDLFRKMDREVSF